MIQEEVLINYEHAQVIIYIYQCALIYIEWQLHVDYSLYIIQEIVILDWNNTKAKIQSQNRRSILAKIENTNMTTHSPDLVQHFNKEWRG